MGEFHEHGTGSDDGSGSDSSSVSVEDEKLAEESVLSQMLHAQSGGGFAGGGGGVAGGGHGHCLAPGERPDVGAYAAAFALPGSAHRTTLSQREQARYNSAMMIHPSVWGYQLTPLTSHDSSKCHPVFFDYYLKLGDDAELDRLGPEAQRDARTVVQFKARAGMPQGDCPVCFTTDVPGCPCCWEFNDATPIMRRVLASEGAAKRAHIKVNGEETVDPRKVGIDFDDPDITADVLETYLTDAQRRMVRAEQLKSMHTKLKTRGAVLEYRQLRCDYIKIYVKGLLPMSPACWFTVEKSDTVGYLYNQYRANAGPVAMATRFVQLLLPTETGIFLLDNTDIPEDDMYSGWTTTDRKLAEYSIFTDATSIALLMVPAVNYKTPEVLDRFFKFNVSTSKGRPDCSVRGELADIPSVWSAERNRVPPKLPGDDEVQAAIVDLLLKEAGLYKEAEAADKAEREAALDAKMRARYGQRKHESLAAVQRHREAKEAQRLDRLKRMEERARELADAMVPFVPKKKKRKKPRRRAVPPPKASTLYVARALAARALQKARLVASKAPLAARNLALAGKDAVKNFYIQKLERTIADEADQRLMDDKPEPIYPAVRMVKQAAFPFALEEQLVLRGRGLTMKFCLTALRALGKPYEMPEEYVPPPRKKVHRFHRHHLSKSQVAHMRQKELAKLRLRQALEKANPTAEAVVEVRPPTPSSSESEDEPMELPDIFGDSGAKPENLIKREKFHLPILAIPKGVNS